MWIDRLNQRVSRLDIEGSEIEVLGWAYNANLPSNVAHRHTFFEVCLVGARGQGRFESGGNSYALGPGSFFLARPGEIHQIINTSAPDMELSWISFAVKSAGQGEIARLWQAFKTSATRAAPAPPTLRAQWQALRAFLESLDGREDEPLSSQATMQIMASALLLCIAHTGAGVEGAEKMAAHLAHPHVEKPALASHQSHLARLGAQYVHDNLDRALSISEIAAHLGVSRRQISRLFSAYTGVSPALYLERARLDRAEALLRHSQKSVKEIAREVGYADVHHFSRAFRRVVGTPPAEYRARGPRSARPSGPHIPKRGSLV